MLLSLTPPTMSEIRPIRKKKSNINEVIFWFKYLLTVFVASSTLLSSLDGKLTTEEIENAGIVLGVWAVHSPAKLREKKDDSKDK